MHNWYCRQHTSPHVFTEGATCNTRHPKLPIGSKVRMQGLPLHCWKFLELWSWKFVIWVFSCGKRTPERERMREERAERERESARERERERKRERERESEKERERGRRPWISRTAASARCPPPAKLMSSVTLSHTNGQMRALMLLKLDGLKHGGPIHVRSAWQRARLTTCQPRATQNNTNHVYHCASFFSTALTARFGELVSGACDAHQRGSVPQLSGNTKATHVVTLP